MISLLLGYTLDITSGQRKYGGPPPNWTSPPPGQGCEIFVGKIPKDVFEDELIEVFEKIGKIWDLRLMIDPVKNESRGYAFVTFCNKEDALTAVKKVYFMLCHVIMSCHIELNCSIMIYIF